VAGCLPPLGESYRPDMVPADEAARPVYANLVSALEPYVDLFICETMSSIRESLNAASMARQIAPRKPIWMAWTLAEEPGQGLRSGESVADAVAALESLQIDAFLFNCTSPTAITAGLESLSELTDKPTGAYPNRLHIPAGWTLDNDVTSGKIEMSVAEFVGFAEQWRQRGASIIGGCCGIGPEFIEGLKQARG
ncbi:MAG TPA: homocysteine S-methyltransferase, partial [Gammaproteobacteria bacterium]|nr:homocysteine S-methyltransferase [Gammaproteobacteria bacterium]